MTELEYKTRIELLRRAIEKKRAKDHEYEISVTEDGIIHFLYKNEEITTFDPATNTAIDNGHSAKFFEHFDAAYPANIERNIRALEEHFGITVIRNFQPMTFSGTLPSGTKQVEWSSAVKTKMSGNRKRRNGTWAKGKYLIYSIAVPSEVAKELDLKPKSILRLRACSVEKQE